MSLCSLMFKSFVGCYLNSFTPILFQHFTYLDFGFKHTKIDLKDKEQIVQGLVWFSFLRSDPLAAEVAPHIRI